MRMRVELENRGAYEIMRGGAHQLQAIAMATT